MSLREREHELERESAQTGHFEEDGGGEQVRSRRSLLPYPRALPAWANLRSTLMPHSPPQFFLLFRQYPSPSQSMTPLHYQNPVGGGTCTPPHSSHPLPPVPLSFRGRDAQSCFDCQRQLKTGVLVSLFLRWPNRSAQSHRWKATEI